MNRQSAPVERFAIPSSMRGVPIFGLLFFSVMAVASATLPFMPEEEKTHGAAVTYAVSIAGIVVFGGFAGFAVWMLGQFREASISVDGEGIWKTNSPREAGLTRWTEIVQLRERNMLQRLELLDRIGSTRARLEHQLDGFTRLVEIVRERASLDPVGAAGASAFTKPLSHHLFFILTMIGLLIASAFIGIIIGQNIACALFLPIALLLWFYLSIPCGLELTETNLIVSWPLRRLPLSRKDVISVKFEELIVQHGQKIPRVLIRYTRGRRAIAAHNFGIPAFQLKEKLDAWLASADGSGI